MPWDEENGRPLIVSAKITFSTLIYHSYKIQNYKKEF